MQYARMVELVDTLVSGTRARKGVQVQVLFRAEPLFLHSGFFYMKKYVLEAGCLYADV